MKRIDIQIPQIGVEQTRKEISYNEARYILQARNEFLSSTVGPLGEIVDTIVNRFNTPPKASLNHSGHELPDGATRGYYTDFLENTDAGRSIFKLWFGENTSVSKVANNPQTNQLLQSILYGFNKLKVVGASGKVEPRKRKAKIGEISNPVYQIHTHVEVPFVLKEFGLVDSDLLSISLGVNHDTTEEGVRAVVMSDGHIDAEVINTKDLVEKYPTDNLGTKLAIGIQILTESERVEIEKVHPIILKDLANKEIRLTTGKARKVSDEFERIKKGTSQSDADITEHLLEGPLKYGGLALQVRKFAEKAAQGNIPGLNFKDAKKLAEAVINVEFADRIGDMAGLTRIVGSSKLTPEYQRERIKLYAARMLNMMEKLQDAAGSIGARRRYRAKFDLYKQILEVQLAEVNKEFRKLGTNEITSKEMTDYYWSTAKPIQQLADSLMEDFTEKKVSSVIKSVAKVA